MLSRHAPTNSNQTCRSVGRLLGARTTSHSTEEANINAGSKETKETKEAKDGGGIGDVDHDDDASDSSSENSVDSLEKRITRLTKGGFHMTWGEKRRRPLKRHEARVKLLENAQIDPEHLMHMPSVSVAPPPAPAWQIANIAPRVIHSLCLRT